MLRCSADDDVARETVAFWARKTAAACNFPRDTALTLPFLPVAASSSCRSQHVSYSRY